MGTSSSLGKNVELLRQDASKMIDDLSRLQADLVQEGKLVTTTSANKLAGAVETRVSQGMQALTHRMESVAERVARLQAETKRQLSEVDATLHKRPYSYYALGGAFTIGLLGGLLLPLGRRVR